jgi:hypothetical protein
MRVKRRKKNVMLSLPKHLYRDGNFLKARITLAVEMLRPAQHDVLFIIQKI